MILTNIGKENYEAFRHILPFVEFPGGENRYLCIGAIEEGKAAGAAALSIGEYEALLESIYVLPDCRRKGIGRAMLTELLEGLKQTELPSLSLEFAPSDGMKEFLEAMGFFVVPGEALSYTSLSYLKNSRLVKNCAMVLDDRKILPMAALSRTDAMIVNRFLSKAMDPEDIKQSGADPKLSYVMYDKGLPVSCILVSLLPVPVLPEETEGKTALVSMLYSESGNFQDLLYLLTAAILSEAAVEKDVQTVAFYGVEKVRGLVLKLLHGKPLKEALVNYQAVYVWDRTPTDGESGEAAE